MKMSRMSVGAVNSQAIARSDIFNSLLFILFITRNEPSYGGAKPTLWFRGSERAYMKPPGMTNED